MLSIEPDEVRVESYLECPVSLLTGPTSVGSSDSECSEKSSGTFHMKAYDCMSCDIADSSGTPYLAIF